jgi:hypothetical protein
MVEVTRAKYPLNPTLKLVNAEGRATAEFFRVLKAIGDLISNIEIEDGEVKTEMLEAQIIRVSTLFADEVIITSKVAPNAISDITIAQQVGLNYPDGSVIVSTVVPVSSVNNTGVILTFTGVQGLPATNSSNFGSWRLTLYRNGVMIDSTGDIFYDDNFATLIAAQFVDTSPGTDPSYSIVAVTTAGPGDLSIYSGLLNAALFKR